MERHQQVSRAFAMAACLAFGGGCVHTNPDAKIPAKTEPQFDPAVKPAAHEQPVNDPAVQPAAARIPTGAIASLAKAATSELPKGTATDLALAWQNKVAQLPDPTRNGAMVHGVVGQMFLFAADSKVAPANGSLTVDMFDATPGPAEGKRLGTWTFEKDVLKRLVTMDERFGKSHALFLPWPEFDANVARVKLKVRYDPEKGGFPLYAPVATLTFDTGAHGAPTHTKRQVTGVDVAGFGGFQPMQGSNKPLPPLDPLPVGGRNAQNAPPAGPNTLPALGMAPLR